LDRRKNIASNFVSNDSPAALENKGLRKANSDGCDGNLSFRTPSYYDNNAKLHSSTMVERNHPVSLDDAGFLTYQSCNGRGKVDKDSLYLGTNSKII